jgi:hypothetical protein
MASVLHTVVTEDCLSVPLVKDVVDEEGMAEGRGLPVVARSFFSGRQSLTITTRQAPVETVLNKTLTIRENDNDYTGEGPQSRKAAEQ